MTVSRLCGATRPLLFGAALVLSLQAGCDTDANEDESEASTEPATDEEDDSDGLNCAPNETICDGECSDLTADPANCGSCGWACEAGGSCVDALCIAACEGGEISCGGTCIDPDTNDAHCGDCDDPCAPGTTCEGASCACGDTVSFAADVVPILQDTCTNENCHDADEPDSEFDLATDAYAALVNVPVNQCGTDVRVSPGNVEASYLMKKLLDDGMCTGERMPRDLPTLSNADLAKIANWICHGAAND